MSSATPVVIFCGGRGLYIDGRGHRCAKALVEVNQEPMVVHVLRRYLQAGFSSFILAAGYQQDALEAVLTARYGARRAGSDGPFQAVVHGHACGIRVVDTGLEATTGDRLQRVRPFLGSAATFAVTYSDTLSTLDLARAQGFHEQHGKVATILSARVPTRFRILGLRPGDPQVRGFASRPVIQNDLINGGFYFFKQDVFQERYFPARPGVVLEEQVLEALAAAGELMAYSSDCDWHYLDSERDLGPLARIAAAGDR